MQGFLSQINQGVTRAKAEKNRTGRSSQGAWLIRSLSLCQHAIDRIASIPTGSDSDSMRRLVAERYRIEAELNAVARQLLTCGVTPDSDHAD